jgi:hypothetical protein
LQYVCRDGWPASQAVVLRTPNVTTVPRLTAVVWCRMAAVVMLQLWVPCRSLQAHVLQHDAGSCCMHALSALVVRCCVRLATGGLQVFHFARCHDPWCNHCSLWFHFLAMTKLPAPWTYAMGVQLGQLPAVAGLVLPAGAAVCAYHRGHVSGTCMGSFAVPRCLRIASRPASKHHGHCSPPIIVASQHCPPASPARHASSPCTVPSRRLKPRHPHDGPCLSRFGECPQVHYLPQELLRVIVKLLERSGHLHAALQTQRSDVVVAL